VSPSEQLDEWRRQWVAVNAEKERCVNDFLEALDGPPEAFRAVEDRLVELKKEFDRLMEECVRLTGRDPRKLCAHGYEWRCEECCDAKRAAS
jgi:hypothetical protein